MCIIAYKPINEDMPSKDILKMCFANNPDGAGFMFIKQNKVQIIKGLMTFKAFYDTLRRYKDYWKTSPFVLHFRISTQAGITPECTHPFPLSTDMKQLKKLRFSTNIGIAHNGIISLTSNYWKKDISHSDTMEFITDYLALIIQGTSYHRSKKTLELIEKLADSKLAILDNNGHCELIGNFTKDNGIYYSNSSYKPSYKTYFGYNYSDYENTSRHYNYNSAWYDDYNMEDGIEENPYKDETAKDPYSMAYDEKTHTYYFYDKCPVELYNDYSVCEKCSDYKYCLSQL